MSFRILYIYTKRGAYLLIEWTPDLETGVSEIDKQHQPLFHRPGARPIGRGRLEWLRFLPGSSDNNDMKRPFFIVGMIANLFHRGKDGLRETEYLGYESYPSGNLSQHGPVKTATSPAMQERKAAI